MKQDVLDDLRRAYDRSADERDAAPIAGWKEVERAAFANLMGAEGKIDLLELGAGPGHYGRLFADEGFAVTSIDLSPDMVALGRAKGLNARVMDLCHLTFTPDSFDAVFALNCLLHVGDSELPGVLEQIAAILRPNGLLYYGVHGGRRSEGVWEDDHHIPRRFFNLYTDEQLLALVKERFDPINYHCVRTGSTRDLHFQSLTLRLRPTKLVQVTS